jgi:hypothetical protein
MLYLPPQLLIVHKNKSTSENITQPNLQPMIAHSPLNNTPNAMECFPMSPIQRHVSRLWTFSFRANVFKAAKMNNS